MSNNKWSEQRIEQLLSQAPKMNDVRSKEEVFNRLKQEQVMIKTPRKQRKWAPPAVAVAAILTLTLLTVTFLNQGDPLPESASHMQLTSENDEKSLKVIESNPEMEERTTDETENEGMGITNFNVQPESFGTSLYPSENLDNMTFFKIGLIASDALSVPVTFLIPNDRIREDFGNMNPTSLELYQQYAPLLNEEELGFMDYHPYKGTFTIDGESLILTLPKDHTYDLGSGSINVFKQSLKDTFESYNEIMFRNEDGTAIEFDQVGEVPPYNLKTENLYNYFMYQDSNGKEFLTPNFGKSFESLSELPKALQMMKEPQNDIYTSVIPENITFETETEKGVTKVMFSDPLDLVQMDPEVAMNMIEGMLLTGASFGSELQFENVVQDNWSGFDFTRPLPMPIGPNELPFPSNE